MSDGKIVLLTLAFPFVMALLIFFVIDVMENLYFDGAKDYHNGIVICTDLENTTHCIKKVEK
jgi:hypothetical protein